MIEKGDSEAVGAPLHDRMRCTIKKRRESQEGSDQSGPHSGDIEQYGHLGPARWRVCAWAFGPCDVGTTLGPEDEGGTWVGLVRLGCEPSSRRQSCPVVHQAARISSTASRMLLPGSCYRALACSCRRFGTARRLRTDSPTAFAIEVVLPDVNHQRARRCNVTMRKYQVSILEVIVQPETAKLTIPKNAVQDASLSVCMQTAMR